MANDERQARDVLRLEHGGLRLSRTMIDTLEVRPDRGPGGYAWEGEFRYGGDINRLVVKSEGEGAFGEHLEQADFECACPVRESLLGFVVAGGGFAGVETVAAINDFVRDALAFYPNLNQESLRVVLVHDGPFLLPELGEKLGVYAQRRLAERKVEIRLQTRITGFSDGGVALSDGTRIPSRTLIWTAGTSPHPLLATLPCRKDRGRIVASEYMAVPEWSGVWALGDCAVIPDSKTGKPYPPTAQHALRQGKVLAGNIVAAIGGGHKKPFVFTTIGLLASIGKRTGTRSSRWASSTTRSSSSCPTTAQVPSKSCGAMATTLPHRWALRSLIWGSARDGRARQTRRSGCTSSGRMKAASLRR